MYTTKSISTTDARVFAVLLVVFGLLFAGLIRWFPGALLGAAVFTAAATLISILFNGVSPRLPQARGFLFSGVLAAGWVMSVHATVPGVLSVILVFVIAAALTMFSTGVATRLRTNWMDAAAPIGWGVSAVLLSLVYLLILTPIGLLRRLGGADPLTRRFEGGPSYWIERPKPVDRRREYRQY